ncbi:hypothetical protein ZIOFF_053190 [Zingiber officinale]|uniref:Uncharacterized protein n=1 Tax=Zingiber officinale TaxID=94328 RepID=A0A8J5KIB1_ZINOF|nr:hypothetical protein ZIOFF_053190 [Zingiber officinale]
MAATTSSDYNPSYQRLRKLPQETEQVRQQAALFDGILGRRNRWLRLNRGGRCRRPRIRVAGLRRLLRNKTVAVRAAVSESVSKVLKRLKEGRPYLGELFAGNYLFVQVSPSPTLPYLEKTFLSVPAAFNSHHSRSHGYC